MLHCEAKVIDTTRQKNLMHCIKILGGEPTQHGNTIMVDYDGDEPSKMIALFEQFLEHIIAQQTTLPI